MKHGAIHYFLKRLLKFAALFYAGDIMADMLQQTETT